MKKTIRLWTALGAAVTAGTSLAAAPAVNIDHAPKSRHILDQVRVAQAGEGGSPLGTDEAGEPIIPTYGLFTQDPTAFAYDASTQLAGYVGLVHDSYAEAHADATTMQAAIAAFLADPTAETLAAARAAWVAARPAYVRTEAYRFYDGPIEETEGRINAWPLNEAFIDYVEGDADAGLVNDLHRTVNLYNINRLDQSSDEADVTTGWHAIEFLLWGQDLSLESAGQRPYTDYLPGTGNNDRRRDYLRLVTDQLVGDLDALVRAWSVDNPDSYANGFLALDPREAVGRVFNGIAVLAGFEFMSARLATGLDSGDQEDEHSCFSDTTHQDFVADFDGIAAVWTGDGAGADRPGFDDLLRTIEPDLTAEVDALLAVTGKAINALGDPWDRVLASEPGSPERVVAEEAVTALQNLADGLKKAGNRLGVLVLVPAN